MCHVPRHTHCGSGLYLAVRARLSHRVRFGGVQVLSEENVPHLPYGAVMSLPPYPGPKKLHEEAERRFSVIYLRVKQGEVVVGYVEKGRTAENERGDCHMAQNLIWRVAIVIARASSRIIFKRLSCTDKRLIEASL